MVFNEQDKKVFEKLKKIIKESSEVEYRNQVIGGGVSNEDYDILIEYIENEIKFVKSNHDSNKRFEITQRFFKKLQSDNLYDSFKKQIAVNSFFDAKKVGSSNRVVLENLRKYEEPPDSDKKIDAICKYYAYAYERACRLFFKPLASTIAKKKIDACGTCIIKIIEYFPEMEFVLESFIPQIRNSIDHLDYYYDLKQKLVFFDDRDKQPLSLPVKQLRILTSIQVVSELSMTAAHRELDLPLIKFTQQIFKKTQEYCKIVGIDFHTTVIKWVSEGRNILRLHNALKKMIKDEQLKKN